MKSIRDIMSADPIRVRVDASLREAVELLIEHNVSGLPVVAEDERIVGVIGDRDLLRIFYEPQHRTIESVMTADPKVFAVTDPLVDVADYLMAEDFRRVLIHEKGRLVGLVSRADLMPAILAVLRDRAS